MDLQTLEINLFLLDTIDASSLGNYVISPDIYKVHKKTKTKTILAPPTPQWQAGRLAGAGAGATVCSPQQQNSSS